MKLIISKEKRKGLLFLVLIVVVFFWLGRWVLRQNTTVSKSGKVMGLNTQLPPLPVDRRMLEDKLRAYEQADNDSARREQYRRQDPYRRDADQRDSYRLDSGIGSRAGELEQRLVSLQRVLHAPPADRPMTGDRVMPVAPAAPTVSVVPRIPDGPAVPIHGMRPVEERAPDPLLERINAVLDKVIRIQHPEERVALATPVLGTGPVGAAQEVLPADSSVNSIAAVVPEDQTLTSGTTIMLRLTDSIRVVGRVLPAGQLVYGVVTINGDRLLVHVAALREDRNLFTADWQVYDLDGLAGIHIPGVLGRDVAKQSADQGVNALNVVTLDPGLAAQATGAGIQAAKSFLGRKVRQVRVTVRAGYQVLLRNPRVIDARLPRSEVGVRFAGGMDAPPEWEPEGAALERCRNEGMEVVLRRVCIRDSCLWFGLEWINRTPIPYVPAYVRWAIRDRRVFRRTAMQEQPLEPVSAAALTPVGGDSTVRDFTGFRPFALSKDKELVVTIGEKGGGRTLELVIHHGQIVKARTDAKASQ